MSENGTAELSARQARAVGLLLAGNTVIETARSVRCSKSTLYRWAALPVFQAALTAGQDATLKMIAGRLSGALDLAIDVLIEGLDSTNERVRQQAAVALLQHYAGLSEFVDLAGRVTELEHRI